MKVIVGILMLLFSNNLLFAQSKNQISDRKIKNSIQHTTDYRKEKKIVNTISTHYDKHGNILEQIEYNEDSMIINWEKYSFNKNDDEIVHLALDKTGLQQKKIVSIYNSFHKLSETNTYSVQDSLIEKTVFDYNNFNDKISESVYTKDDKLKSKSLFNYDNKGMLQSKTIYNADNKIIYSRSYQYEY